MVNAMCVPTPRQVGVVALWMALGTLGTATAVLAQQPQLEAELRWLRAEAVQVITPSLLQESPTEAAATVVVITRRQILERGYRNLQDLLKDLPGVDVQNYSEPLWYDTIGVRGIAGNHKFVLLLDGVRIGNTHTLPATGCG